MKQPTVLLTSYQHTSCLGYTVRWVICVLATFLLLSALFLFCIPLAYRYKQLRPSALFAHSSTPSYRKNALLPKDFLRGTI